MALGYPGLGSKNGLKPYFMDYFTWLLDAFQGGIVAISLNSWICGIFLLKT
jgi:hypothetical protein